MKESQIIDALQSIDSCPTSGESNECMDSESNVQIGSEQKFEYRRSHYEGFPTAVVGDVGTCKVNCSVKNKHSTAFGWMTEIPGDLHSKEHLCEAVFKAHGKGGFLKIVNNVMKRCKLTEKVFKKRKFQDQNQRKRPGCKQGIWFCCGPRVQVV